MSKAQRLAVELSLAVEQTLQGIQDELRALQELASDLGDRLTETLVQLHNEVAVAVADAADAADEMVDVDPAASAETPPPPEAMSTQTYATTEAGVEDRVRATPFTRAPRSTQIAWLLQVMADGDWHTPVELGRRYANDERHFRYLRHAIGGRFREMFEDGDLERRDSQVKGAMFEYRLKPKP